MQSTAEVSNDTKVFHAGTRLDNNQVVTAGGRVLCVTALGETIAQACDTSVCASKDDRLE